MIDVSKDSPAVYDGLANVPQNFVNNGCETGPTVYYMVPLPQEYFESLALFNKTPAPEGKNRNLHRDVKINNFFAANVYDYHQPH